MLPFSTLENFFNVTPKRFSDGGVGSFVNITPKEILTKSSILLSSPTKQAPSIFVHLPISQ